MASITARTRRSGDVTYQVRWREHGSQTGATFDDKPTAEIFRAIVDGEGSDAAFDWLTQRTDPDTGDAATLDTLMADYIAHLPSVHEGTRGEYTRLYARTYGPLLGAYPADAVTKKQVAAATIGLTERLSYKSINNAKGLIYAAYEDAVQHDDHPTVKRNPVAGVQLPDAGDEIGDDEIRFLTPDEFGLIYNELPGRWRALPKTLVQTGMRWSEATALPVANVHLNPARGEPRIHITRAWKKVPGGHKLGPPKTRRSRRFIELDPDDLDDLEPLVAGRRPDEFVFTSTSGLTVQRSNFYERVWGPALWRAARCPDHARMPNPCGCGFTSPKQQMPRRCGVHKTYPQPCGCAGTLTWYPRLHDLRHTFAAWQIAANINLVTIQDRLGHESITTTVDVYGGLLPNLQQEAAKAITTTIRAAIGGSRLAIEAGPQVTEDVA